MIEEKPKLIPVKEHMEDLLSIYVQNLSIYIEKEMKEIQHDAEKLVDVLKNQMGRKES